MKNKSLKVWKDICINIYKKLVHNPNLINISSLVSDLRNSIEKGNIKRNRKNGGISFQNVVFVLRVHKN